MIAALTFAFATLLAGQQPAIVTFGDPVEWATIDTDAVKGRPAMLAWSDDAATLYFETVQGTTVESLKFHHYLIPKGGRPKSIDARPTWAEAYWKWKSSKAFFGDPLMVIEVATDKQVLDNLNGIGSNKAAYLQSPDPGHPAMSGQDLILAKQSGGTQVRNRLLYKNQVVGEFIDEQIVPGYTFGWSPRELCLMAFRNTSGHLAVMNAAGETAPAPGSKDAVLPAWSDDGSSIAYLERLDRKKLRLLVVSVQ